MLTQLVHAQLEPHSSWLVISLLSVLLPVGARKHQHTDREHECFNLYHRAGILSTGACLLTNCAVGHHCEAKSIAKLDHIMYREHECFTL